MYAVAYFEVAEDSLLVDSEDGMEELHEGSEAIDFVKQTIQDDGRHNKIRKEDEPWWPRSIREGGLEYKGC